MNHKVSRLSREIIRDLNPTRSQVEGFYKVQIGRLQPDGTLAVRREYEFPNLITDLGLERMAENMHYNSYCQVGTGTTTPAFSDTGLATFLAQSSTGSNTASASPNSRGIVAGPPRYAYDRRVWRFNAGVGTGNITEVGVGWLGTGNNLYSRSLILDGGGSPIAITKLSDEVLDVTYELRTYVTASDVTGTITINGSDYDYTIRAMRGDTIITDTTAGWGPASSSGTVYSGTSAFAGGNNIQAYTGGLSAITSSPSGGITGSAGSGLPTITSSAYVGGSLERVGKHVYGLGANVPIRTIGYRCGWGSWQCQFVPDIPKTGANQFTVQFKHSWARRTL